jgi:hypothetical protein
LCVARYGRFDEEERVVRAASLAEQTAQTGSVTVEQVGWWERRKQRRRLTRQDELTTHLAELLQIRALVSAARDVVAAGWVQDAWYVRSDERGRLRSVMHLPDHLDGRPIAGACLVGAILHANGGVATAGTQLAQRTFDLTWHTLNRSAREPVRWCPAPPIRARQLSDLVGWNDQAVRTAADVETLLISAEKTVDREVARSRHQLATLV